MTTTQTPKIKKTEKKIKALLVANAKTDLGFARAAKLPNLGLCSIAAHTDKNICDVKVLDLVVIGKKNHSYLKKWLIENSPDVVGFSCMTFQYQEVLALAKITKSVNKNIITIIGGYHATVAGNEILNDENSTNCIDYIMKREGEMAFNAFVTALYNKKDYADVPNLSYKENGEIINTKSNAVILIDELKVADRSARVVKKGFYLFGNRAEVIETSRGCSFNCDFCSIRQMYGKSYRKFSIDRVIRDLQNAKDHGAKAIFIVDDNITLDGNRYKELCQAIIDADLNTLKFFIQASIKGLRQTPGLIELMTKAGVNWIFLGIENISDQNLAFLDKSDQFKSAEVYEVVTDLRKNKILTIGGFIIGNPDDTEETLWENFRFARKLKIDVALFFILTPFPKTEIREKLFKQELITNPFGYTDYTCFKANVKTNHLSSERLYELREEMGYKYPMNGSTVLRMSKEFAKHPMYYIVNLGFDQLINEPGEIFGYMKGLIKS